MILFRFYLTVLLLSSLIGLYHYRHLPTYLRCLSIMLVTTLLVETVSYFLIKNNAWIFNIYTSLEFIFYFLLFKHHSANQKFKKVTALFMLIFIIVACANILFFQGFYLFNNYTHSLGAIFVVACAIAYYRQLLGGDKPEPLIRIPMFWISTGLLIFYASDFFFMALFHYIISVSIDLARQLYMITAGLNIVMYSLFIFGIISSVNNRKEPIHNRWN